METFKVNNEDIDNLSKRLAELIEHKHNEDRYNMFDGCENYESPCANCDDRDCPCYDCDADDCGGCWYYDNCDELDESDNPNEIGKDFKAVYDRIMTSNHGFPPIDDVVFNNPATIVYWADGTKTVAVFKPDEAEGVTSYDRYTGLMICLAKKAFGNDNTASNIVSKWMEIADKRDKRKADLAKKHEQNVIEDRKHKAIHAERVKKLATKKKEEVDEIKG